jgi:A/G-specific adenine glycosylase
MTPFPTDQLLSWYEKNARDLPWRRTRDPYAIWVSEIMLQQTRVETVIPYYQRWLEQFPTVGHLAEAEEDQVLTLWEGLGYYRRARYLHQAARQLCEETGGNIPADPDQLQELPGIGSYTAAALASIAFGRDEPAVDGNIRRVITRYYDIGTVIHAAETERVILRMAQSGLPAGRAGTYNQALMELGALICTPRSPACEDCPIREGCLARQRGVQDQRPVRKPKKTPPHLQVTAAVFQEEDRVLLAKRKPGGLLGGLWEFPGGKQHQGENLRDTLTREIREELGVEIEVEEPFGRYQHAYSHFSITLHAFRCSLLGRDIRLADHTEWAWVPSSQLDEYPMGKVDRQIAERVQMEYQA